MNLLKVGIKSHLKPVSKVSAQTTGKRTSNLYPELKHVLMYKGGGKLEGTVRDLPKRNISNRPKWMILECIAQLFKAIQMKIFLESFVAILKSKMGILMSKMAIFGPY